MAVKDDEIDPALISQACKADAEHPNDITRATANVVEWLNEYRRTNKKDYVSLVKKLIRFAARELIYHARSSANARIKAEAVSAGRDASATKSKKQPPYSSQSVRRIASHVFDLRLGTRTIGDLLGKEISAIREKESALASGHQRNAALLAWLEQQGFDPERRVRDCIDPGAAQSAYERIVNPPDGKGDDGTDAEDAA